MADFSSLPSDILLKISATFTHPDLTSASSVCKSWRDALHPLREAMACLKQGKRYKRGRRGFPRDPNKALDCFLKAASLGSTLGMVDAGLLCWELGERDRGVALYAKAARLGDHAGQCNLGISLLTVKPPNAKEAVKWLYKASIAGLARAQCQLALCLHEGCGVQRNALAAAKWYLRAAESGYVRAMYNISLCYALGEGLPHSYRHARKWMKRAADRGHSKAQYEYGLGLFLKGEMVNAVVYLELACRAGENAAANVKNVILEELPPASRDSAMRQADNWRSRSSH